MDQPNQRPLTRKERIALEREAAKNGQPATAPLDAVTDQSSQAPRAETPAEAPRAEAPRPFVRPAQRNSRNQQYSHTGAGCAPGAYGSAPQHYGSAPQHHGTAEHTQVLPTHAHQPGESAVTMRERPRRTKPEPEPLGFVRGTIRGFGELCITAGMVLILFVVWQLWWTDIEANRDNSNLASQLTTQWRDNPRNELPEDPDTPLVAQMPEENKAFGIMYIPRFGEEYYRTMAEGVSLEPVLNRMGVGHYPSTARPGEVGNFAIAGHRVTYGKPLNLIAELQPGDPIVVQTAEGFYTYTMRNFEIVLPNQTEVLAPVPGFPEYKGKDRLMTMTACNPMFSARERYVVYAELTDWRPAAEGPPETIADSKAFKEAGGQ